MFDFGSEEPLTVPITSTMALELTTILLGLCVAAVAVLYAAPRGYLGHKRLKASTATTSIQTYTPPPPVEEAKPAPTPEPVQSVAPPAQAPAPAIYESVQPAPAPAVTYSAPSSTSFGAPTISRKPTRTYRRRTAPVRSTSSARSTKTKPRKREAR